MSTGKPLGQNGGRFEVTNGTCLQRPAEQSLVKPFTFGLCGGSPTGSGFLTIHSVVSWLTKGDQRGPIVMPGEG